MKKLAAIAAITIAATGVALAQEFEGPAEVRSGNEISVGGSVVRLYGIVAPGREDKCEFGERQFKCGIVAWAELVKLADGEYLSCDVEDKRGPDDGVLATCYVAERDVNEALVRSGWAEAAQGIGRYRSDQEDARRARRGLWAGRIKLPDRRQAP